MRIGNRSRPAAEANAPPISRRFTLLDGMILISATAAGFALMRPTMEDLPSNFPFEGMFFSYRSIVSGVSYLFLSTTPLFSAWSFCLVLLRLRPPRPSLHRLFRQPGLVASISASIGSVIATVFLTVLMFELGPRPPSEQVTMVSSAAFGGAILTTWSILFLSGRWRSERSWVDRAGRVLGVCWIIQILALLALSITQ